MPTRLPDAEHAALRGGPGLRWGVMAPGVIADKWVGAVHEHTDQRVVAVGSRSIDRATAFAAAHGIPNAYGSYLQLVADPAVEAVYVAAPHSEHTEIALLAIAAGKHVLVEKPLAVTAADGRRIVEAARHQGVFAMEALWTRFLPQTTVLARLLADGALGRPRLVTADFGGRPAFDPGNRLFDPLLGGGALLDLGIYSLWFSNWVLGEPGQITARGIRVTSGVDGLATVVTEHHDAIGVASCSLLAATPTIAAIDGEDARVEIDAPFCIPGGFRLVSPRGELRYTDPEPLGWHGGLAYQVAAVAAHVAAGRLEAPEHPLDASLSVLHTIDEARRQLGVTG